MDKDYLKAFTMAEILISLTIIGVIAAITLPALRANINETTWATQRKALYSRMSQAISMMPSLNGYGIGATEEETAEHATEAFITDGLSKVLKIKNICDKNNRKKCGFPDKFTRMGTHSKINTPTTTVNLNSYFNHVSTNAAAFETTNGESVLTFYNPNCIYDRGYNSEMQRTMCANFIYDLNGRKGPNKVGKDIGFITAFYPTDSQVVAPYPIGSLRMYKDEHPYSISWFNAACRKEFGDTAKLANIEEIKSVFTNNTLGYNSITSDNVFLVGDVYSTSTVLSGKYIRFTAYNGTVTSNDSMSGNNFTEIFCVKK